MRVHEIIDRILPQLHPNRQGFSYGQLALLFVAYVIHLRTRRLSCHAHLFLAFVPALAKV